MTEPQQPAAPLEVDDPEPAPPEPNPTLEAPPAPEPQEFDPSPAFEAPRRSRRPPEALEAPEEEHADEAPPAAEPEATEPDDDASVPADDEPRLAEEPAFEPEPAAVEAPAEPRSAGHFVAEALRAAGVRYAFTVPGESFLGVLEALGDVGIRVVATRHEGAAAFMAEAYGQLTGRPAACLGTRAVGAANLAIGIHTASQDSTPMFAIVGQVERDLSRPGGIPGGRPDRVLRAACQVERRACDPSTSLRARSRKPSSRPSAAGPARSCCRFPRTCSMRPSRVRPGSSSAVRRRPVRPTRTSAPCSAC